LDSKFSLNAWIIGFVSSFGVHIYQTHVCIYYRCHIMQLTKIYLQRYIALNKYVITNTCCGVIDTFKQKYMNHKLWPECYEV